MPRYAALLRGINLGSTNRVSMPDLRSALAEAGFDDVATYVQSGNIVLSGPRSADEVARRVERVVAERFGLDVPVVVRTARQIVAVVDLNPLGDVATDLKRYQVSFLAEKPPRGLLGRLEEVAAPEERVDVHGREIYAWHPAGVARSKLWALLAGTQLGVTATARNWITVTKLRELLDG